MYQILKSIQVCIGKFKDVFAWEEVEVTFSVKGNRTVYNYKKVQRGRKISV